MSSVPPQGQVVAIAHRAGNNLSNLERAKAIGVDLVELDVWLHRGRLEVRHARSVGLLPLLRENWRPLPGWGRRLVLDAVIEAAGSDMQLMVDLKSESLCLSEAVASAFDRALPGKAYAVTTREWWLLEPFEGCKHVCLIPSAAWADELSALKPLLGERYHTLSLHISLVERPLIQELASRGVSVYVWPVNSFAELDRVFTAGVKGINSDSLSLLGRVVADYNHPLRSNP